MEPSARPRIRPPFLDLRPSVPRPSVPGSSSVRIVPWFVALLWTAATAAFASTPPPTVLVWAEDPRFDNVARRVVAEIEGIQGPADPPWTVRLVPRPEGDTPSARLVAGGEGASLAVPVGPKPGDVLPSGTAEEVLPDAVWVDPVGWLGPPFEAGDDAGPLGGPRWVRSAPLRSTVEGDLRAFRHLLSQVGVAPEDRPPTVAVPLDPWLAAAGPEIALGGQAAGVSVRPVEPAELLGLPRGSAVYLPPGSTPEGLGGMAQRGLIIFSGRGGAGSSADVGSGALAARSAGDGGRTLARLAALEVLSRIRGLGPGAAPAPSPVQASSPVPPVPSALEARLVLDLDLAQRLGLDVPWRLRLYSETFGDPTVGEVLTLDEARRGAVDANLDLRARALATAAAEDDVRRAVAVLRPQVTVRGEGRILDEDSAEASFGQSPERLVTATGEATWILFSEDARSALEVRRRVQAARELELRQVELDLGLEAASTYLRLARLLAVEAIERQTLSRTLAELDAARARRGVGASSRADVARLESRAARDRRALVGAHGARRSAEVTLARLLSRPQDAPIVPGDPSGDDSLPLEPALVGPGGAEALGRIFLPRALETAPEIAAAAELTAAAERELAAAKRSLTLPSVRAFASVQERLVEDGAGDTSPPLGPDLGFTFDVPETSWSLGVGAELPILTGGARASRRARAVLDLDAAKARVAAAEQRVEERVRLALLGLDTAYEAARQARRAQEAAAVAFEAVAEGYGRGTESLTTFLDAQTELRVARLERTAAAFDGRVRWLELQRASGAFLDAAEVAELSRRLAAPPPTSTAPRAPAAATPLPNSNDLENPLGSAAAEPGTEEMSHDR